MAEVYRQGIEHVLQAETKSLEDKKWKLPKPVDMGPFLVGHEKWRELANEYPWPPDADTK